MKVAILDLNADAGEKLAKELGGIFAKCDVTSEPSVDAALAAARKAHGQERILVNCAGIGVGQAHLAPRQGDQRHRAARSRQLRPR